MVVQPSKEIPMRGNRSLLLALALCTALAGCAGTPKVEAVGDAYHVATTGTPVNRQADVNYRAVALAHDYCAGMKKELMFRQSQESGDHPWSPKREDLTFV